MAVSGLRKVAGTCGVSDRREAEGREPGACRSRGMEVLVAWHLRAARPMMADFEELAGSQLHRW